MKKLDFIHQRIILATTVAVVGFLSIAVIITAIRRNTDAVLVFADEFMIATANPKATKAGYQVLKDGGTAMDAIITAQMVLNVVEPQSSGIGGGAFLLYWDAQERRLRAYDGRETAPIDATPKLFLDEDGKPMDFAKALIGGRAVGTPGLLRMPDGAPDTRSHLSCPGARARRHLPGHGAGTIRLQLRGRSHDRSSWRETNLRSILQGRHRNETLHQLRRVTGGS